MNEMQPPPDPETARKAVLSLNVLNQHVQKMKEIFETEEPIKGRKLRRLQIVHQQMRDITEEWA